MKVTKIVIMALMACTACTSTDDPATVEPQPPVTEQLTPIAFAGNLQEEQTMTRATGLEEKDITAFTAWAYKNDGYDDDTHAYTSYQTVMNGFAVHWQASTALTTSTNTHDWEYIDPTLDQTVKYWDWNARAYRFFGVAGSGFSSSGPTEQVQQIVLSVDATNTAATPFYSHLWFSTGNAADYPDRQFGQPVVMQFLQPLARVRFMFTIADDLTFTHNDLAGIRFRPTLDEQSIATRGTVTISYPLTGTATEEDWASTPTEWTLSSMIEDYRDEVQETWYTVLPVQNQGSYTVQVVVNGGDPKTATVPAEYMRWMPGYDYTYRFKILDGGNVTLDNVQVAINDWTIKSNVEHPVYNW